MLSRATLLIAPILLITLVLLLSSTLYITVASNSTYTQTTKLDISDSTESFPASPFENITFYADYYNVSSGEDITGTDVYCEIYFFFDDLKENMSYNPSEGKYIYQRYFEQPGYYEYRVLCNGTSEGYDALNITDKAWVEYKQSVLDISDTTDTSLTLPEQNVTFYAHYYNASGDPIVGEDVYCQIRFLIDGTWTSWVNMTYNSTSEYYQYTRNFSSIGNYTYQVLCNATYQGYGSKSEKDFAIIDSKPEIHWLFPELKYRKKVIVENPLDYTLHDYQVKLNFTKPANMLENCEDIRVSYYWNNLTHSNETEINYYYTEKCSSNVVLWVKIPDLKPGNNTIFIYYGNLSKIEAKSNASLVFDFFDDFENGINWDLAGDASPAWITNDTFYYHGSKSARSNKITHLQEVNMSKTLALDYNSSIEFYWKVSSEDVWDRLYFYVNGSEIKSISGEVDWTKEVFNLQNGSVKITFSYKKSASVSEGEDAGFVDYVYVYKNVTQLKAYYLGEEIIPIKLFNYYKETFNLANLGKENTLMIYVYHPVGCGLVDKVLVNVTNNTGNQVITNGLAIFHKEYNGYCVFNYSFDIPLDYNKLGVWKASIFVNDSYGLQDTIENKSFWVKTVNITLKLNDTDGIVNPLDVINLFGNATLLPDNTSIDNNEIWIYLDEKRLHSSYFDLHVLSPKTWFNDSWEYRSPILINNSANNQNLTDYQLAINISYNPHMQPDFDDIRFTYLNSTDNSETKIPYWIEQKVDGSWAYVWIKVPFIPDNQTDIGFGKGMAKVYIYYGNTTPVESESRIDSTFTNVFFGYNDGTFGKFDDCYDSPQITTSEIFTGEVMSVVDVDGRQLHAGNDNEQSNVCYNYPFQDVEFRVSDTPILHFVAKFPPGTTTCLFFLMADTETSTGSWYVVGCTPNGDRNNYPLAPNPITLIDDSEWHIYEYNLSQIGKAYMDTFEFYDGSGAGTHRFYFDNFLFYRKVLPEPSYSIQPEDQLTETNQYGYYNYTLIVPAELGNHIIKVNITNPYGIYGEITKQIEIIAGNLTSPSVNISSPDLFANNIIGKTHSFNLTCGFVCKNENCSEIRIYTERSIFRKPILINNSANNQNLTDYQLAINISYNPHMQPDFDDIRFTYLNSTDNSETKIPYWIEQKVDGSWAYVWIKVPFIPDNNTDIGFGKGIAKVYMYYGNPSATSESNGDDVFIFYDDFEGDKNWTYTEYGTAWSGSYDSNEYVSPVHSYKISYPSSTSSSSGYYGRISKSINCDGSNVIVEVKVKDDYTGSVCGFHFKQIYLADTLAWEDDVCGDEGGWILATGIVKPEAGLHDLILQVYDKRGVSSFNINVWWDDVIVRKHSPIEPSYSIGLEEPADSFIPISSIINDLLTTSTNPFEITKLYANDIFNHTFNITANTAGNYTIRCRITQEAINTTEYPVINETITKEINISVRVGTLNLTINKPESNYIITNKSDTVPINITATCYDFYCGNVSINYAYYNGLNPYKPILYLKFDEETQKLKDYSGYNNPTFLGSGFVQDSHDPTYTQGYISNALQFDGVDDYVRVEHSSIFDSLESNNKITITAWINIYNWYSGWFPIVNKYESSNDRGWEFAIHNTNGIYFGSNGVSTYCNVVPTTNEWHFVAVSYDYQQGKIYFYLDGELKCINDYSTALQNTYGEPLYIGYSPYSTNEYANGLIDELMIFNRSLTEQEIKELYYQEKNKFGHIANSDLILQSGYNPYNCGILDPNQPGSNVSCTEEILVNVSTTKSLDIFAYTTNDNQIKRAFTSNITIKGIVGNLSSTISITNSNLNIGEQTQTNEEINCNNARCFYVNSYLQHNYSSSYKTIDALKTNSSFWYRGNKYFALARDDGRIYIIPFYDDGTIGSYTYLYDVGSNSRGITIGDFDNDGCLDIVSGDGSTGYIYYMKGYCDGTFAKPKYASNDRIVTSSWVMDFAEGDFNNDGCLDIITSGDNSYLYLLKGNCDGTFNVTLITSSAPESKGRGKDATDLNNDGNLDLIYTGNSGGKVYVFYGYGDGSFSSPVLLFDTKGNSNDPYGLAIADLDNDNCPDIVANGGSDGNYQFWKNDCSGNFTYIGSIVITGRHGAAEIYDFNNDGLNDLIITNYDGHDVLFYKNLGDYTFEFVKSYDLGANLMSIAVPYELSYVKTDRYVACNQYLNANDECSYSRNIIVRNDLPTTTLNVRNLVVSSDEDVANNHSTDVQLAVTDNQKPTILSEYTRIIPIDDSFTSVDFPYYRNMILHYDFDDNLAATIQDRSGNNLEGKLVGPKYAKGYISNALQFDGTDDYVRVEHSSIFDSLESNNKITITAWINIYNWYSGWFPIVNKYESSNDRGWEFAIHNTNGIYFSTNSISTYCNVVPTTNEWHFVAVSYEYQQGKIYFYLDGELKCINDYSTALQNTYGEPLYIGYSPYGSNEYANGLIDELMIFNRSLTEQEIKELYYQEKNKLQYHNVSVSYYYSNKTILKLQTKAMDNNAIDVVYFEIKKPDNTLINITAAKQPFNYYTVYLTNFDLDGNYTLTKIYAKDLSNNWNYITLNKNFTIDNIPPTYSNLGFEQISGYDSTIRATDTLKFFVKWKDFSPNYQANLSYWIFSWNGTCNGNWINETYNFSQPEEWSNITKTLASCLENRIIGFRFYGFDKINNTNATPIITFYVNYSSNLTFSINDPDLHYDIDDILKNKTNVSINVHYMTATGRILSNATVLMNLSAPNGSLVLENYPLTVDEKLLDWYADFGYLLYRSPILINNSLNTQNLTDYQLAINISYNPHMQPDFDDIRFTYLNSTDNSETKIPYWIEQKVDGSWAYVWIKVPFIPDNNTDIGFGKGIAKVYMYYGNTTLVESDSNFDAVFDPLGNWYEGWKYKASTTCNMILNDGKYWYDPTSREDILSWSNLPDSRGDYWGGCDNCDFYIRKRIILPNVSSSSIYISSDDGQWLYVNGQYVGHCGGSCHSCCTCGRSWSITSFLKPGENIIAVWCSEDWGGEACEVTSWNIPYARTRKYSPIEPSYTMSREETNLWYYTNLTYPLINQLGKYNFTIIANKTIYPTRKIQGEFYVQNASITLNLDKYIVKPGDNVTIFGNATLLPDNTSIADNEIGIYLDDKRLYNSYFNPHVLSPEAWFNDSWEYRSPILINNSLNTQNLTDYQLAINISYNPHMQPDFDDIRFTYLNSTDNSETKIPYWIEQKVDGSWAYVWIKVPFIPDNQTDIGFGKGIAKVYMYYGNPSAESESNGEAVFEFYDDFDNLDKWHYSCDVDGYITTATVDGFSVVKMTETDNYGDCIITNDPIRLPTSVEIDARVKSIGSASDVDGCISFYLDDNNVFSHCPGDSDTSQYHIITNKYAGSGSSKMGSTYFQTNWQIAKLIRNSTHLVGYYNGETLVLSITQSISEGNLKLSVGSDSTSRGYYVDWIRVRGYSPIELTYSIQPEEMITYTDKNGSYNYTFTAPTELGNHIIKVNITNPYGIYGENSTLLKVRSPSYIEKIYSIKPNYTLDYHCTLYNITIGNYRLNSTDELLYGKFSATIDNITKYCFGLGNCTLIFSVGKFAQCDMQKGNKTIYISIENETAYYWPLSDIIPYNFADKNLTFSDIAILDEHSQTDNILNPGEKLRIRLKITEYHNQSSYAVNTGNFNITYNNNNYTLYPEGDSYWYSEIIDNANSSLGLHSINFSVSGYSSYTYDYLNNIQLTYQTKTIRINYTFSQPYYHDNESVIITGYANLLPDYAGVNNEEIQSYLDNKLNSTNLTGNGYYTIVIPALGPNNLGMHNLLLNLTDSHGIYGENTTTFEVYAYTDFDYSLTPNFTYNDTYSLYNISIFNVRKANNLEQISMNTTININNTEKSCSGNACYLLFKVCDSCEIKPGINKVNITLQNYSAYYEKSEKVFYYYFEDLTTTGYIIAHNISVYNVSNTEDKIDQFNFTIKNTGKATMHNITIVKYSGPFEIVNATPIPDVPPESEVNITFNITIPAGTLPTDYHQYYQFRWIENNNETHSWVISNKQTVRVVGNPVIELSTYNITQTIAHGTTYKINITINSTGNKQLSEVNITYVANNLPNNVITIEPNYFDSIPVGSAENFTVTISLPPGFQFGNFSGIINVTSNLAIPEEARYKEIIVNITVPRDSRWVLELYYPNGTKTDIINQTFPLNLASLLANISITNIGNDELNFTINYISIGEYDPMDPTYNVFTINKEVNGELYNPEYIFVPRQTTKQIKLYQNGYGLNLDFALNITISNSTANPIKNYTLVYWRYRDQAPFIVNVSLPGYIETHKTITVTSFVDDDQDQIGSNAVYCTFLLPNGTIYNTTASGPYPVDGYYSCSYTTEINGLHRVNITACDLGKKCRVEQVSFQAIGRTYLQANALNSTFDVAGVTQVDSQNLSINISIENFGLVYAYLVNITSLPPGGTSWIIHKTLVGTIANGSTKYALLNITIPEKTAPGSYNIQPYVEWRNPDYTRNTNYTQVLTINVLPTRIIEITKQPENLLVRHGTSNYTSIIVYSKGNDALNGLTVHCMNPQTICPYIYYNVSTFDLQAGENASILINVTLPKGFASGTYYPIINVSNEYTSDTTSFSVSVPLDTSWQIDKENVTIKEIDNQIKTIPIINLTNSGNANLNFEFTLTGNITNIASLTADAKVLDPQESYSIMLSYTTPNETSYYEGNLTINELNYGESKLIPIYFYVYKSNLTIHSPTASNPIVNVLAGYAIPINVSLRLMEDYVTNDTVFNVSIDNKSCSVFDNKTIGNFWEIDCYVPELEDGRWHNITVTAHYLDYDIYITAYSNYSIYYKDITPPSIQSIYSPSVEYGNNVTIKVNITDNVAVDKAWVFIDQLNQTYYLTKIDNNTFELELSNLEPNDYDTRIYANDTTNNKVSGYTYFEVYIPRILYGNVTNAADEPVNVSFDFYRNNTNQLLQTVYTVLGRYNTTIHERLYDIKFSVYDSIVKIYNVNATLLPNDFIKIDYISPAETNLVNSVNGIAFNSTLNNSATIRLYYDQDTLVTYGLTEDYLKVFACRDWEWEGRNCNSSDKWQELPSFTINKLYNYIEFNVSEFSSSETGYTAYVIAEKKPASYAELTVYDPDTLTMHHGTKAQMNITVKSTGTSDVLNAKVDCISGSLCYEFNPEYLRYMGNLPVNDQKIVTINFSAPLGYAPGKYYGVLRFSADNINPIDKTIEVVILDNRTWFVDKDSIYKEVGISYGYLASINVTSIGNVKNHFNVSTTQDIVAINNFTLDKLSSYLLYLYYNTTNLQPGVYNESINITSIGSTPELKTINITLKVVNFTIDLIQPNETIVTNINDSITLKTKVFFETQEVNDTNNVSFDVKLNDITLTPNYIIYNTSSKTFDTNITIPLTKVNTTLYLTAKLLPQNYSTQLIKQGLIIVNDTVAPVVNRTEAIVLENKTIINIIASDNDKINETRAIIHYPNGTSLNVSLNKNNTIFYAEVNTTQEGDYRVDVIAIDAFNNTRNQTFWFRVSPLIYLAGSAPVETKIELYKPVVGYKFKEALLNNSYNITLRAGSYDVKVKLEPEDTEVEINNATINKSLSNPIKEDTFPTSIVNPGLTKTIFKALAIKPEFNFSYATIYFNFSSYVDQVKRIDDLRIYHCHNWSFDTRECLGNWSELDTRIDKTKFIASANLTSFSGFAFAESVVCGNGICESEYGETHEVCPSDCPATPVCGNGVCELGENWQNCPSDCHKPTFSSGTSSTRTSIDIERIIKSILESLSTVPKEDVSISRKAIDVELYQGETLETKIEVTNNMNETASITISSKGKISDFVSFRNPAISLAPGSSAYLTVVFNVPFDTVPGVYSGEFMITYDDRVAYVPVNVRVLSVKNELLDLKLNLLADTVAPGKALPVEVTLYNMGKMPKTDVNLTVMVFDFERGETVTEYRETLAVETSLSRVFYLKIPKTLPDGKYMVKAIGRFAYEDRSVAATSYTYFTVKTPLLQRELFGIPLWELAIYSGFSVITLTSSIIVYRRIKKMRERKRRFRIPLDLDTLPKPGPTSLFIGNVAETGIRAFIDMNALRTHVMIAGSTGSGKTVSAMVIAEEALKKGVNVIVFDPTAQWTGFMRRAKEKFMLKYYKKFGMKKSEARRFNTQIKVIEDPYEYIDIKELMKGKGKITVFVLNKLSHSQLEEFVASVIKQVFDAQLEESHELRTLLVFDEVHRMLTKFGATGKGFLAIERATREFRKWGVGLMLISQVLSDFVGETRANIGMEIQFRTRYEGDLERIRMKYGEQFVTSVVKAGVGTGMIVYSEYNKGRPYFVEFRPLLHQASRLSDKELETYVKYDRELERIRRLVKLLKERNVDTFDLETELKLAESKLAQGAFDMVDIYLESLRKTAERFMRKYRISEKSLEAKKLTKEEISKFMEKSKKLTKEDLKTLVQKMHEELKDKIEEAKMKGIDVFDLESQVDVLETKIRIAVMENDTKTLKEIMNKLKKIENEIRGREK